MTKTEFQEQFKRLRVAGYRLPVFDGITIADVITEWYGTFGGCTVKEFSAAIDRLKQAKTDTFWPATGELWAHVYEVRKANRIRSQANRQEPDAWAMSEEETGDFLAALRACRNRIVARMAMPKVSEAAGSQVEPDHVLRERESGEIA